MRFKGYFIFLMAALFVAASTVTAYASNPVRVQLDGNFLEVDAVIVDDRTLAPARAIVEALGGSVGWDGDLRQVTINHGTTNILLTIDNSIAYVNGSTVLLDVPPQIINGLTKIPVRFVGESLGVDIIFHYDGFVVINTALGFGGVPQAVPAPPVTIEQPTLQAPISFSSFQQVLDAYTIQLREATPRLLDEFRAAAVGITDITTLAEISIRITSSLAEISVSGTAEMANLWIVRNIGNEAIYMDYAARLNAVYMEEAARISALYMELAMGGGQTASITPPPPQIPTPTARTFAIGDIIQLNNATVQILNTHTRDYYYYFGSRTYALDGHYYFGISFIVTGYSMGYRHNFFHPMTFVTHITHVNGSDNHMSIAFGDSGTPFFANQQRNVTLYFHVPIGQAVASIHISDGEYETATVNI